MWNWMNLCMWYVARDSRFKFDGYVNIKRAVKKFYELFTLLSDLFVRQF